ncbi:MAG: lipoprotein insertase outer membrane protein LolB [Symbiopectobacterium sp.]|uniref:lipoprotein insertase outer membrane protein LolB n=1 Tax=Symbiopectobacterium sp. TaxID=2952789 RepID=UPI003F335952
MLSHTTRALRLLLLASLLLTACTLTKLSGPTATSDSTAWLQHKQQVQQLSQYQTRGAFAYLSDSKKLSANFFWQESSTQRYRLLLTNPFGGIELELRAQPDGIQITDVQGKRYIGKDAEYMLSQLTGIRIPLTNLRQWMIGLPGDAQQFTLDEHARLSTATLVQNGLTWEVKYLGYDNSVTPTLPNALELTQGEQRIKLKMNNWTVQ